MKSKKKNGTARSLAQYARDKRKEGCEVCALPSGIRAQMVEAKSKNISRTMQIEWLRSDHGIQITSAQLDQHYSGRHMSDDGA